MDETRETNKNTHRSAQYTSTWSRVDRMYIMHTDSFLLEILDISISYDLVLSDHFPLVFEFAHQSIDLFKYFLRQPPLRFNSSFLEHEVFHGYMCQLFEKFNLHVQAYRQKPKALFY